MKKVILITLLYTCALLMVFSTDPKDFVAGLFCLPPKTVAENMMLIADRYEEAGYDDTASDFRGFSKGWYGSGFLVKNSEGNLLLVSNKHVLGVTGIIKYRFETSSNGVIEFEGIFPVFQDPYLDLAIVDIPDDKVKDLSFIILADRSFSDGDDIFSAGYPMLLGEPAWQLSKGVISNKSASVNGIISSEYTKLIQHSASIDGGNSGGPLLVKSGEEWIPVGVNTWSVTSRNDTFFAIPMDKVTKLIEEYQRNLNNPSRVAGEKHTSRVDAFVSLLNSDGWDTSRTHWDASVELTNEKGWNAFQALLEEPKEIRDEVGKRFGGQSYYQIMRESTLWWIWKNLKMQSLGDNFSVEEYGSVSSELQEGDKVVSTLKTGESSLSLTLEYYRGDWYVADMDFLYPVTKQYDIKKKAAEDPKKGDNGNTASAGLSIYAAPSFLNTPISGSSSLFPTWGLGGFFYFDSNQYLSHGMSIHYLSQEREGTYYNFSTSSYEKTAFTSGGIYFDYGLSLGYPVEIDDHVITPFIEGAAGAGGGFETASAGDTDSEMIMIFYARYGGGLKYLNKKGDMGAVLAINKRSGSNLGFDEFKLDTLALRIDLFWALDVLYY